SALGILLATAMAAISSSLAPALKRVTYTADNVAESARIDPYSWITLFRRDYKKFEDIKGDLSDQGWSEARIEALKFYTMFMPTATDIVHWYAREVYEPDMVKKYGL
ncbi:unnamed protein product, partial [marine sediment metagenome]